MNRWLRRPTAHYFLLLLAFAAVTRGDDTFDPDRTWQMQTLAGEVRVALPARPIYSEPPSTDAALHIQRFNVVLPRLIVDIMITRRDNPGPLRLDDAAEALHKRLQAIAASKQGRVASFSASPTSRGDLQGREMSALIKVPGESTRNRGLAFARGGTVWLVQTIYREDDDVAKRGADRVLNTFEVIARGA